MNYQIKNEFYTVTVTDLGAELISVKDANGFEYIWQNEEKRFWGGHAPLLFPLCGTMRSGKYYINGEFYPIGQHGFARDTVFKLKSNTETELVLEMQSTSETLLHFPFEFTLCAKYSLCGDKLSLNVSVENRSNKEMAYMFGWHPAFNLPTDGGQDIEDYTLKFAGNKEKLDWKLLFDMYGFKAGEIHDYALENGAYRIREQEMYDQDTMVFYGAGSETKLSAAGYPFELNIKWSDNLPTLCFWKSESHDAKYLCIEPWTNILDHEVDFDPVELSTRGVATLSAGGTECFSFEMSFKK